MSKGRPAKTTHPWAIGPAGSDSPGWAVVALVPFCLRFCIPQEAGWKSLGFQMVRYYGWYSNRARGERAKQKASQEEDAPRTPTVEIIDVSRHQPRRIPDKKWRDLIKKVWECDPLTCVCGAQMRIVSLIDDVEVIERILRHLGLWPEKKPVEASRSHDPPQEGLPEFPTEEVVAFYDDCEPLLEDIAVGRRETSA